MEPLLGVETAQRNDGKKQSIIDREAAQLREGIPGTVAEREEEERLDAGIGRGGAFGNSRNSEKSIERTVWEFRSEEMVMAEKAAEAKAAAGAETGAEKAVKEQEAAPDTPDQVHVEIKEEKVLPKTKAVKRGNFRFVETSVV
jgi:hypothetical protein